MRQMLLTGCWCELAFCSHLVLGQVCILNRSQDHAQQCLLLLWPQRLERASLEAAKHTQINITVCQACSNSSSSGSRSMSQAYMYLGFHKQEQEVTARVLHAEARHRAIAIGWVVQGSWFTLDI
jgi:hypothetical protein